MPSSSSPSGVLRVLVSVLFLAVLLAPALASENGEYLDRMSAEHADDTPTASDAAAAEAAAEVETSEVTYATVGEVKIQGFLAQPAGGAKGGPAVIVIQEWWGLNDNIKSMARQLAELGYTALAVDLYRGQVADNPEKARELAGDASGRESDLEENLRQAHGYLTKEKGVGKVGVIGWCFEG